MYCEYENGECVKCGVATRFPSLPRNCCNSEDCRRGDIVLDKPQDVSQVAHGPGTELKKLLAGWPFYITSTPDCSCNAHAAEMNYREHQEPGWCAANVDTILAWLREQAAARGLPFVDLAGRMLIRRAIKNATNQNV